MIVHHDREKTRWTTHVEDSEEKRKTAVQFRTAPREGGHRFDPGQLGSALAVAQWQSTLVKRRAAPARDRRHHVAKAFRW